MKVRTAAARLLADLLRERGSLASRLPEYQPKVPERDRALLQELAYGSCRWYPRLRALLDRLLTKPLKGKDADVLALLLLGLYQLEHTRIPDHAAIGATVEATRELKKPWARGLVNGVLRRFQREREALDRALQSTPAYTSAHPDWLRERLAAHWPEQLDALIAANNDHPPLTLRLGPGAGERKAYLERLRAQGLEASATPFSAVGITLHSPCPVAELPGFNEGWLSVQDEAAQLAAGLLAPAPGERVLDACAAPGGKTGHLLEHQPGLEEVVALDNEARRLERVRDNLARLGLNARVLCGDATDPSGWWDGRPFDRILLDAPCSATGILRRQPDVKLLRSAADIERLAALQGRMLEALWECLAPGGLLLYATCSVLPEENTRVVEAFVAGRDDARCEPIEVDWGLSQPCGRQLLPRAGGHDGFYYAPLRKQMAKGTSNDTESPLRESKTHTPQGALRR